MRLSTDDIKISYVDSDDDIIPVDSEMEFRECLKFSRVRARHGRKVVMKVSVAGNGGAKPKENVKMEAGKDTKPKLFCLKKRDIMLDKKKPSVSFESTQQTENDYLLSPPVWFDCYMQKVCKNFLVLILM